METTKTEYKTNVSVRLSIPNLTFVDKQALKRHCSRSEIIEEAVVNYIQEMKAAEEAKQ
jgi:metal-responsive CopG/Arc/MetJ family transcriptional regulator